MAFERERRSPDLLLRQLEHRRPFRLLWMLLCVEMRAQYANCLSLCQAKVAILT